MTTKNTPVKFTKQKMIEDINSLRKITMEKQYLKSDLGRLFPALYCYKVVDKLIELGFLKFSEKQAKGRYYKWNFDTKVDLKIVDALFSSVLEYRDYLSKKSSEHRVMRIKKQELIKSQEKANLQAEEPILEPAQKMTSSSFDLSNTKIWIGDNPDLSIRVQQKAFDLGWTWWQDEKKQIKNIEKFCLFFKQSEGITCSFSREAFEYSHEFKEIFESDLFPEIKQEKQLPRLEKLSFAQQLMYPDELARDLGLVPTEEQIEAWKEQIAYWKHESESLRIKLEKKSIELKDLKTEMKRKDDYVYDMSFKNQDELDKVVKRYEKLLSEKTLEPTFVPKEEEKKPFVPVLGEIKKQEIENKKPTKYLKLFGYMIYEKN